MSEPAMVPGEWPELIAEHLTWMAAAGQSEQSMLLRRTWLRRYASGAVAMPAATTSQHLTAFLAAPHWAPETRHSAKQQLRGFFGWATRTGRLPSDPTVMLPAIRRPSGQPRPVPDDVLNAALAAASPETRLMLLLAAYAGLRRAEIAAVHTDDIANGRLRVRGKGGRVREIPLHPVLTEALSAVRPGFVFPGRFGGHLTPNNVGVRIAAALPGNWSAHSLRHWFASNAYAAERDLLAVQELLGHSKPETTRRYTATPEGARERAVRGLTVNEAPTEPPRAPVQKSRAAAEKPRRVPPNELAVQRLRRAVEAAEQTFTRAWLWLLASRLTVSEMEALRLCDVMLIDRLVFVSGRRARAVKLAEPVREALAVYIGAVEQQLPSAMDRAPLFVWRDGTGPIPASYIEQTCRAHMRQAGISNATGALRQLPSLLATGCD